MGKGKLISLGLVCTTIFLLFLGLGWHGMPAQTQVLEVPSPPTAIVAQAPPTTKTPNFSPPSPLDETGPPELIAIRKRNKLVVAMLGIDNPPFFMTNTDGQIYGLDVTIAQAIGEELGVPVEFDRSAQTFNETVDLLVRGKADIAISKLSRTLNRAKRVVFSKPYVKMRQGMIVNRLQLAQKANGRTVAALVRQLDGKVGVIKGSSYVGFTKQKFPQATPVEFPAWDPDVIKSVTNGNVLAAYRDELEVKRIVLSRPDAALKFQTIAFTDTQDPIAIAVPWKSTHLLSFVNQLLETRQFDFTVDKLIKEYPEVFRDRDN